MTVRILRTALAQLNKAGGGVRPSTRSASSRRNSSGLYLATLGGMAIVFLTAFWLALAALNGMGLLPPPQFSNNLCIDEKLAYLRAHPIEPPTILTVGSSVAWRSIDSARVSRSE